MLSILPQYKKHKISTGALALLNLQRKFTVCTVFFDHKCIFVCPGKVICVMHIHKFGAAHPFHSRTIPFVVSTFKKSLLPLYHTTSWLASLCCFFGETIFTFVSSTKLMKPHAWRTAVLSVMVVDVLLSTQSACGPPLMRSIIK